MSHSLSFLKIYDIMFNEFRSEQFAKYNAARDHFIANPQLLIDIERFFANQLVDILKDKLEEIVRDYNEASYLYPFWENYPPDDRGRKPKGDQIPWIEVGEHAVGSKLPRLLENSGFTIRDTGLPAGPDERFVITHPEVSKILGGYSDSAWLFIDIKSVGPRDDAPHTVMSHNQISGSGQWLSPEAGVSNSIMTAKGLRASHDFHCSLPPLYVLSDGKILPLVLIALKPIYSMASVSNLTSRTSGQPLERMTIVTIPNGLLLEENPGYLQKHPGLLFPGKDDKTKDARKLRARVSFDLLEEIAPWRVQTIRVS